MPTLCNFHKTSHHLEQAPGNPKGHEVQASALPIHHTQLSHRELCQKWWLLQERVCMVLEQYLHISYCFREANQKKVSFLFGHCLYRGWGGGCSTPVPCFCFFFTISWKLLFHENCPLCPLCWGCWLVGNGIMALCKIIRNNFEWYCWS